MRKGFLVLLVISLLLLVAWMVLSREKHVSAREFKSFFMSHVEQTHSTWKLYKVSKNELCFEYSRPVVPERYCVDRSELLIDTLGSDEPKVGFVYAEQLSIKGSGPNAQHDAFTAP